MAINPIQLEMNKLLYNLELENQDIITKYVLYIKEKYLAIGEAQGYNLGFSDCVEYVCSENPEIRHTIKDEDNKE